jgi:hypothetical protein
VEDVAISTDEGWDLAELVDLEVLWGDVLADRGVNDLEIDVVCLGNCTNGSRAGVALCVIAGQFRKMFEKKLSAAGHNIPRRCRAFRMVP